MSERRHVVVIGAGGHSKVLLDALALSGIRVAGITDADPACHGRVIGGATVLGDDRELERFAAKDAVLVNGIGSVSSTQERRVVFERFKARGFAFLTVVHPSAIVSSQAFLEEGAQVMAGAVLQPGTRVGADTIVNTGAQVDHDCEIGSHIHIAPGVVLSGSVKVGDATHIGTAAAVIQGIRIGRHCLIAAGAMVVNDVEDGERVAGMPARRLRK